MPAGTLETLKRKIPTRTLGAARRGKTGNSRNVGKKKKEPPSKRLENASRRKKELTGNRALRLGTLKATSTHDRVSALGIRKFGAR